MSTSTERKSKQFHNTNISENKVALHDSYNVSILHGIERNVALARSDYTLMQMQRSVT